MINDKKETFGFRLCESGLISSYSYILNITFNQLKGGYNKK